MLNHELWFGPVALRAGLVSKPRIYSIAGRKLNAPAWMPIGSNGRSSGGCRRFGGVVAMVAVTASGLTGGAPGRFWLKMRPGRTAPAGCSCFGVKELGVTSLGIDGAPGAAAASAVEVPADGAPGFVTLPGLAC